MTLIHRRTPVRVATAVALLAAVATALVLLLSPSASHADAAATIPDPLATGPYTAASLNPYLGGTVNLQEPNAAGGAATGANAAANLQVRGSMYYPSDHAKDGTSPIIVLVHGNHASCAKGTAPNCTVYERNDLGYTYLARNLATWGYTVISLDQDQLIYYQDSVEGKGMHQRRLLIAANLDMLYAANQGTLPTDANNNIGDRLKGMLDFNRIGLMGHSRGGDAVTSFLDYNRTRPAPGRRYDIRGVDAVAPVDYERRAPYGTNYMTEFGACDGDVSNLQGARFFERSQYIQPGDPFPRIQMDILGANHDAFNTIWYADGDDANTVDSACGPSTDGNIRLTGGATNDSYTRAADGSLGTAASDDPADMGDQEKIGLATMSEFFRTYVGGETAFAPYLTGELGQDGTTPASLPASACPTSHSTAAIHGVAPGSNLACDQRIMTSYFAPAAERLDVIRPETDHPLTLSAVGTSLTGSGFANPFQSTGGVSPVPATTAGGYDWCNPEPDQFVPADEGLTSYPTAEKSCPLPVATAVGGQSTNRENSPVNQSYGMQLALAWDHPVQTTGAPATLATTIPQAKGDVSGLKSLTLAASVNFFDSRNPARTGDALRIPGAKNADGVASNQDFQVQLTDASGKTATVDAADPRYGEALGQTTGSANARLHIILNSIRIPLTDFSGQGLDLSSVRKVALVFGGDGEPQSGSIQLSDVRFQEATAPKAPVDPATIITATKRDAASPADPDVVWVGAAPATTKSVSAVCADTTKPTATITKVATKKARLTLSGKAKDVGCKASGSTKAAAGKVKTVGVTVYRKAGKKVRYVTATGALSKAQKATTALSVTTRTTSAWTLKFAKALPRGTYVAYVRAIDAAGNQQAVGRRHVIHVR